LEGCPAAGQGKATKARSMTRASLIIVLRE
jgi:hypothetical protein